MLFRGIGAAPGLAVAKCHGIRPLPVIDPAIQIIDSSQVDAELSLFMQAVTQAEQELGSIMRKACDEGDNIRADIIAAQCMMLTDPTIEDGVREKITSHFYPAVRAIGEIIEEQAEILAGLEDPYLRERAADIRDIGSRLAAILLGVNRQDLSLLTEEAILVGREITASQMASLDASRVKGIVAEVGGKTSHTAILADSMGIPAVLGCAGIMEAIRDGEWLLVNGDKGTVETQVDAAGLAETEREIVRQKEREIGLLSLIGTSTRTRDGVAVELAVNIVGPDGAKKAAEMGADGIGLYRTEFLFMNRDAEPAEDEQYEAYAEVLRIMQGKPVIIRTLDVGGDKRIPYLNLPGEENPFLGYRGIRICLQEKALFMTQLRAVLRAGIHGRAMIMYPMIASLEELREANRILQEAKESLDNAGVPFDAELQGGIMVEIPAAAVMADLLIREAAFFSIGSNDLTQYALAVDRMNGRIGSMYNPFQPGVLRLIRTVIEASNLAGARKFTGMCGEMAADPMATLLLLGLGLTEFSVKPSAFLKIKKIITSVDISFAREVAANAMQLSTADEIVTYLAAAMPEELRSGL